MDIFRKHIKDTDDIIRFVFPTLIDKAEFIITHKSWFIFDKLNIKFDPQRCV